MPGLLNELTIRATNVILRGDDVPIWNALKRAKDARHYDEGQDLRVEACLRRFLGYSHPQHIAR